MSIKLDRNKKKVIYSQHSIQLDYVHHKNKSNNNNNNNKYTLMYIMRKEGKT
jgi:hypothetical protein